MDVINLISKVEGLPDAPVANPDELYQPASMLFANGSVFLYLYVPENRDKSDAPCAVQGFTSTSRK